MKLTLSDIEKLRDQYYTLGAYFSCNKPNEDNKLMYSRFLYLENFFIENPRLRGLESWGIFIDL